MPIALPTGSCASQANSEQRNTSGPVTLASVLPASRRFLGQHLACRPPPTVSCRAPCITNSLQSTSTHVYTFISRRDPKRIITHSTPCPVLGNNFHR
ncbi:hypothetical protein CPB85DRAFT_1332962 [Mucidula mucida]|nr:hypothetical protein CPB85DRAFT_1332962 [Mucidula mucida]